MGENVKSPKQPKMLEHVENKKSELLDTQFSKKNPVGIMVLYYMYYI